MNFIMSIWLRNIGNLERFLGEKNVKFLQFQQFNSRGIIKTCSDLINLQVQMVAYKLL